MAGPKPFPFFKHVVLNAGADDFVMFSDGVVLVALPFATFDSERATATLPAYPVLEAGSNGREYYPDHKHVQTFAGIKSITGAQNGVPDAGQTTVSERGGGSLKDPAIDAYIAGIAGFTAVS